MDGVKFLNSTYIGSNYKIEVITNSPQYSNVIGTDDPCMILYTIATDRRRRRLAAAGRVPEVHVTAGWSDPARMARGGPVAGDARPVQRRGLSLQRAETRGTVVGTAGGRPRSRRRGRDVSGTGRGDRDVWPVYGQACLQERRGHRSDGGTVIDPSPSVDGKPAERRGEAAPRERRSRAAGRGRTGRAVRCGNGRGTAAVVWGSVGGRRAPEEHSGVLRVFDCQRPPGKTGVPRTRRLVWRPLGPQRVAKTKRFDRRRAQKRHVSGIVVVVRIIRLFRSTVILHYADATIVIIQSLEKILRFDLFHSQYTGCSKKNHLILNGLASKQFFA